MKLNNTILLIGSCGSGKTWVCKQLIKEYNLKLIAKIKSIYFRTNSEPLQPNKKIAVMGKYDGSVFDGSDKLSMSIMKDVNTLKKTQLKNNFIIMAEGDRFMNKTFIKTFNPLIIKISDKGEEGRKKRNTQQSVRQIKSIETRVSNIKHNKLVENSEEAFNTIKKLIDENIKIN
tara:strand:- start:202 stop:723 length:522 start_codon:yes stop_codon:yes gene_type:complete